jgi:hypothetical protein
MPKGGLEPLPLPYTLSKLFSPCFRRFLFLIQKALCSNRVATAWLLLWRSVGFLIFILFGQIPRYSDINSDKFLPTSACATSSSRRRETETLILAHFLRQVKSLHHARGCRTLRRRKNRTICVRKGLMVMHVSSPAQHRERIASVG